MPQKASAADRLLDTASRLFSEFGIRSVGIDRILAESGVAKATLYQAFGSKEALIVAYLERRDASDRQAYRAQVATLDDAEARVLASFSLASRSASAGGYVGCVFANALTEFPEPGTPIARAVDEHRQWVRQQWVDALSQHTSRAHAEQLADWVHLIYDGALLGSKAEHSSRPIDAGRALAQACIREAASPQPIS